ncbi:MAG: hypothetical protein ACO1RA_04415 [Planctomycetaceae bacterium]
MTEAQPSSTDVDESRSWPRFWARTSIFAAITCCTMNCVLFQLTAKQPGGPSELANAIVGYSSLLLVILGFFAGLVAFFQGFRQKTRDTSIIASLGLILCGGILFLMVWFLLLLQNAKGPKASASLLTIAHHQKIASSGQLVG